MTAEDSRRSRQKTTIQIRQNKKDARMAKLRQMLGLKKWAHSDLMETDGDKDDAMSPCLMQVDWIDISSILTPPKNKEVSQ